MKFKNVKGSSMPGMQRDRFDVVYRAEMARLSRLRKERPMKKYDPDQMRKAQDRTGFQLRVEGYKNWRNVFRGKKVEIHKAFVHHYGGRTHVPTLEYLRRAAGSGETFERGVMNMLLSSGFVLQELVVQFADGEEKKWGVCAWQKDHPSYHTRLSKKEQRIVGSTPRNFLYAKFKTTCAGEQQFCLYSGQMLFLDFAKMPGILLHKRLIFRKAVFSRPPETKEKAG